MPVSRVVVVNMGAATLAVGEGLEYIISPSGGNPTWAFACQHRQIFQVNNKPLPQYLWYLVNNVPIPPPAVGVGVDTSQNQPDIYVVAFAFMQTRSYRLQVLKRPSNVVVQDITYTSQVNTDSIREPLTVIPL
jgi:hypothetical protein